MNDAAPAPPTPDHRTTLDRLAVRAILTARREGIVAATIRAAQHRLEQAHRRLNRRRDASDSEPEPD
jgi:hypothetical protein